MVRIPEHQVVVVRVDRSVGGLSERDNVLLCGLLVDDHGAIVLHVSRTEQKIVVASFESLEKVHSTAYIVAVLFDQGDSQRIRRFSQPGSDEGLTDGWIASLTSIEEVQHRDICSLCSVVRIVWATTRTDRVVLRQLVNSPVLRC